MRAAVIRNIDKPLTRAQLYACFLCGFFLQFNMVPIAWHVPIPRVTQLIMVPLIAFLIYTLAFQRRSTAQTVGYFCGMLILISAHMVASGTSLSFGGGNNDLSSALAFALYIAGATGLYILLAKKGGSNNFAWGIVIGGGASLLAFFMQANGMASLARSVGLAQPDQVIAKLSDEGSTIRLTGMWGHANQVGHVLAMVSAASGYLLLSRGKKIPTILMALTMLVCFNYTGNRGGVASATLTAIAAFFIRSENGQSRRLVIVASAIFVTLGAYALYFAPLPASFYARFDHNANMDRNASGRVRTTEEALVLAIEHPFGMAQNEWRTSLVQRTGFKTPHNGYFALANAMGLVFLALFLWAQARVIILGLSRKRQLSLDILLALAAVQLTISFMFEELGYTDSFMLMVALIMARVYSGAVNLQIARRRRGPVGPYTGMSGHRVMRPSPVTLSR